MTSRERPSGCLDRRQFLHSATLALPLGMLASHALVAGVDEKNPLEEADGLQERSIRSLRLRSSKLDEQQRFYSDVLGLPAVRKSDRELIVTAGRTDLTFVEEGSDEPFYHFAFLIPENKLESARQWLMKRWPIVTVGGRQVVHFKRWNAHSFYFLDPAGNLGEFIAHHDLENGSEGEFASQDILHANEIGIVVNDVAKAVSAIEASSDLRALFGSSEQFAAVGPRQGMFIVVKKGRLWFPRRERPAQVFRTEAHLRGTRASSVDVGVERYRLSIAPS